VAKKKGRPAARKKSAKRSATKATRKVAKKAAGKAKKVAKKTAGGSPKKKVRKAPARTSKARKRSAKASTETSGKKSGKTIRRKSGSVEAASRKATGPAARAAGPSPPVAAPPVEAPAGAGGRGAVERGADIPPHYGEDRLGCLVRDPYWAHCYWELEGGACGRVADERGQEFLDSCRWVVRVAPEGAPLSDVTVSPQARSWHIKLEPRRRYRMELGLVSPDGEYIMLAPGNDVETPPEALAGEGGGGGTEWRPLRAELERLLAFGRVGSSAGVRARLEKGRSLVSRHVVAGGGAGRAPARREGRMLLVLHAHLPYVRHPEHERFLEEDWFFEAVTETYVPLAEMFGSLEAEGVRARAGVVLSPTLSEMLADPVLQGRYVAHLDRLVTCADREFERRRDTPFHDAAAMYCERLRRVRELYLSWDRNPLSEFRRLQERGVVEIVTCGATHGFLPLMKVEETARAQIEIGCRNYEKHFGTRPKGIWLPECAYRPGLDALLSASGIEYFFLDSHGVLFGRPAPEHLTFRPVMTPLGVVAFPRDPETGAQVWSAEQGYPGDGLYREFYRDLGYEGDMDIIRDCLHPDGERRNIGLKYHRVTGKVPLEAKEPYVPAWAAERAALHAEHFVAACEDRARAMRPRLGAEPLICAMYDAELFGHWWYEGVEFLRHVFRRLHDGGALGAVTPSSYLAREDRLQVVEPSASSWGDKGYYEHWMNGSNSWVYPHLHKAEERMVELARKHPEASGVLRRALNQAARELLLAQASDWAFLMATRTAPEYAVRRTRDHVAQFTRLHDMIMSDSIDEADLAGLEHRDAIFQEIDYRIYA
jgi:1,4-alpha-glucan branching enzyme